MEEKRIGECDFCGEFTEIVGLGEESENYTDNSDVLGICRKCLEKRA